MDRDGGDGISVAEFRESVQRLGLGLSDEQTALVVGSLGADEAGEAQAFANSEDYKTLSQDDRNAKFAAMLEQHQDYEISYDSFITRLWRHVELRMSEQEAEPELSIIQKQDRERAKQEEEEAAKRAEPTAEQKVSTPPLADVLSRWAASLSPTALCPRPSVPRRWWPTAWRCCGRRWARSASSTAWRSPPSRRSSAPSTRTAP